MIELTEQEREALEDAARSAGLAVSDMQMRTVNAAVERIIKNRVEEALTDALHPEFGTEWRGPDGIIWKALNSQAEQIAEAIEGIVNHDGPRPLLPNAETATDFANDLQWAAMVARQHSGTRKNY